MKIAILSRNEKLYSTRRLKEAALAKGHDVQIIDYLACHTINIASEKSSIYFEGKKLELYDAIIPRISPQRTFYGSAIVRQLSLIHI